MARKVIDLTTPQPNGKMGEPTKSAWEKTNDNFEELYAASPEAGPKEVTFTGTNSEEFMLNIRGAPGAIPVLHYNFKNIGGGFASNGQLLGGAGARPWAGTGYSEHSAAAYHVIATENHTSTLQGADFSILSSPIGSTWESRIYVANFNGDGDVVVAKGILKRKFNSQERGRGLEVARDSNAEVSLVATAPSYSALYRGYAIGGTLAAPTGTKSGQGTALALCGYGATTASGAAALVSLTAVQDWNDSQRGARIGFETTQGGFGARTLRWTIGDDGHIRPGTDNTYDLGSGASRVRQIYSNNGAINTSDARLKCNDAQLSTSEISAALEIARSIRIFQWKESVTSNGKENARLHVGVYAQNVVDIMEKHGLDPMRYGFVCHDVWDEIPQVVAEDGVVVSQAISGGDRFAIRYEELSMFISAAILTKLDSI